MQEVVNQFLEFRWLGIIFSSTHMQVKVGATIFALILFPLIKRFVVTPIINKIKDTKKLLYLTKMMSILIDGIRNQTDTRLRQYLELKTLITK